MRFASYLGQKGHHPENVMMPIDIAIMASMADKAGHKTHLIDTEAKDYAMQGLRTDIRKLDPDLIVVKAKSASANALLDTFQGMSYPVIGFGQAFNSLPEVFLESHMNLICILNDEPEIPFKDILAKGSSPETLSEIQGVIIRRKRTVQINDRRDTSLNLDELPFPKYDWFNSRNYFSFYPVPPFIRKKMAFMMISRGCPYECIFCSPTLRQSYGKRIRHHAIGRVLGEMKLLKRRGFNIVQFRDDLFTLNRAHIAALCHRLIDEQVNLKWIAQTHVNHVDRELLKLMRRAGCVSLGFGIESGSEEILKKIKKTNKLPHAAEVFRTCRDLGIRTVAFFLIGNPGETEKDLERTRRLMIELQPNLIQVAFFVAYPGSEAYRNLPDDMKMNQIGAHHYNHLSHNFSEIPSDKLGRFQRQMYYSFLSRPRNLFEMPIELGINLCTNPQITLNFLRSSMGFLLR